MDTKTSFSVILRLCEMVVIPRERKDFTTQYSKQIQKTPDTHTYFIELNTASYTYNQPYRSRLFTFKNEITFQTFVAEFCKFNFREVILNKLDKDLLSINLYQMDRYNKETKIASGEVNLARMVMVGVISS